MITILNTSSDRQSPVFEAKSGEELIGRLVSNFDEDTLIITDIAAESFVIDGLCRAAMNYAYNRLVNKCVFKIEDGEVYGELRRLGFVKNDNNLIDDIDNFFTTHKTCGK